MERELLVEDQELGVSNPRSRHVRARPCSRADQLLPARLDFLKAPLVQLTYGFAFETTRHSFLG